MVYTVFVLFHLVGGPQPPAKKFTGKRLGENPSGLFLGSMFTVTESPAYVQRSFPHTAIT